MMKERQIQRSRWQEDASGRQRHHGISGEYKAAREACISRVSAQLGECSTLTTATTTTTTPKSRVTRRFSSQKGIIGLIRELQSCPYSPFCRVGESKRVHCIIQACSLHYYVSVAEVYARANYRQYAVDGVTEKTVCCRRHNELRSTRHSLVFLNVCEKGFSKHIACSQTDTV